MMSGLSIILQEYTEEQDEVMMNVPTYGNFYHTIEGGVDVRSTAAS